MQYPRAAEEHVPLSSGQAAAPTMSTGLLVDTNLDTSVPDAYRPPPPPIPFDTAASVRPETPQRPQEVTCDNDDGAVPTTNSGSAQEITGINSRETCVKCDDMKGSDLETYLEIDPVKEKEIELSKSVETLVSEEEEDVCPTCLEGNAVTGLPHISLLEFFHCSYGDFDFLHFLICCSCRI